MTVPAAAAAAAKPDGSTRKGGLSHAGLKQMLPPEVLARIDLEAACLVPAEEDDLKPQYPPRWQYLRSLAWVRPFLVLCLLYCLGCGVVVALFNRLPDLATLEALARQQGRLGPDSGAGVEALHLALPKSFDELRALRHTLELYRLYYGPQLLQLLTAAYIFLQAFMIPGCVAINILAGSMYSFWAAFAFVGVVSTAGASVTYWLVRWLLKDVVVGLMPARVAAFSKEIRRHQAHLLNYMLFLRATPLLPGWFINLASPIVGVPFPVFLIATGVGHQPLNFFTVQAGVALSEIHSMRDLYSPKNVAFMFLVGLAALVPLALKWQRRRRRGGGGSAGASSGSTGGGSGGELSSPRTLSVLAGGPEDPASPHGGHKL